MKLQAAFDKNCSHVLVQVWVGRVKMATRISRESDTNSNTGSPFYITAGNLVIGVTSAISTIQSINQRFREETPDLEEVDGRSLEKGQSDKLQHPLKRPLTPHAPKHE